MLARNSYPPDYVAACRARIDADVAAFSALRAQAGDSPALAAVEHVFFNDLLLALNGYFVHRTRALEGKDGNPLNEVRVVTDSLMENAGVLQKSSTIKLTPSGSVLGLAPGEPIELTQGDFERLADAFFAELAVRFAE